MIWEKYQKHKIKNAFEVNHPAFEGNPILVDKELRKYFGSRQKTLDDK